MTADETGKTICSFCGKSQDEVRKIVAGPAVCICDECVDLCNDIIEEEPIAEKPVSVEAPSFKQPSVPKSLLTAMRRFLPRYSPKQDDSESRPCCRICHTPVGHADALMVRDQWPICPICIESVQRLTEGKGDQDSATAWLQQALKDSEAARELFERGHLYLVFFLSHEAIEKALVAFLVSRGRRPYGTHSIFWLCKLAATIDPRFADIGSDAWTLDTLYHFSRYPFGTPPKPPFEFFVDSDEAGEALRVVDEVINRVKLALEYTT